MRLKAFKGESHTMLQQVASNVVIKALFDASWMLFCDMVKFRVKLEEYLPSENGLEYKKLLKFIEPIAKGSGVQSAGKQASKRSTPAKTSKNMQSSVIAWESDHARSNCSKCLQPFTFVRRRHHCRGCGKLFCSSCSPKRHLARYGKSNKERTCDACFNAGQVQPK